MLDDQMIRKAVEEVLSEFHLSETRMEIEPALGAPNGEIARQIRLFDSQGRDKATVISFEDQDGSVTREFEEIKEKIKNQLKTLI